MGHYFEDHQSMFAWAGPQVERTLDGIARRYVGNNPPHPPTFRAYSKRGILRDKDYRYFADFNKFFPNAKPEQLVYAWAKYWADAPASLMFDVSCFGPLIVYCKGQIVFQSNIFSERYSDERHRVFLPVQSGWNHLVVRFKKTRAGFGGIFGTWLGKLPYYFLMPTIERDGQEGWIFTEPMDQELPVLPGMVLSEKDTQVAPRTGLGQDRVEEGPTPSHLRTRAESLCGRLGQSVFQSTRDGEVRPQRQSSRTDCDLHRRSGSIYRPVLRQDQRERQRPVRQSRRDGPVRLRRIRLGV